MFAAANRVPGSSSTAARWSSSKRASFRSTERKRPAVDVGPDFLAVEFLEVFGIRNRSWLNEDAAVGGST